MKEINYWDFCDTLTVNESVRYILGFSHGETIPDNQLQTCWNVFQGLKKAIFDGTLKANLRHYSVKVKNPEPDHVIQLPNGFYNGVFEPDWDKTTIHKAELNRWLIEKDLPPPAKESPPETIVSNEKSLTESERNTMLKLIIGMAIDAYGYDPKSNRNQATGDKNGISAKLKTHGINVNDDTIRKYLTEAKEIL